MCPLGGALAIPSTRRPLFPLFRYETCTRCKICAKGCEPQSDLLRHAASSTTRSASSAGTARRPGRTRPSAPSSSSRRKRTGRCDLVVSVLLVLRGARRRGPGGGASRVRPGRSSRDLAAARDGDVLVLAPGVHPGGCRHRQSVTLAGEQGAILDGDGTGHVIVVDAPGVTIEGPDRAQLPDQRRVRRHRDLVDKTSRGVRLVGNNRIEGCRFGIWIHGTPEAEVTGNYRRRPRRADSQPARRLHPPLGRGRGEGERERRAPTVGTGSTWS